MRARGLNGMFSQWHDPNYELDATKKTYDFGVARRPVFVVGEQGARIVPKRFVIVRKDTGAPLAVVSDRYFPVEHGEMVNALDERFRGQGAFFERRLAVEAGGARILAEYRFPDTEVEVRPGDRVMLTLTGGNSFDTSTAVWMKVGAFRLICTNGAIIGKVVAFLRNRHTMSFDLTRVVADLGQATAQFRDATARWKEYAATPCTPMMVWALLKRVLDEKHVAITEKQVDAVYSEFCQPMYGRPDHTLWGLYNAITSVASHDARGKGPVFALLKNANTLTEEAAAMAGR